jgi:antitoxin ParD1/3/4
MQVTIDLPESLATHFQSQISTGQYPTASDYIQALIKEDQARQTRLETLALEGIHSGPSSPMTPDDWAQIRATVRQNLSPGN